MNDNTMTKKYSNYLYALLILVTFFLYIIIRIYAWHNTVTLGEDSDSLGYLENIRIFSKFDFKQVMDMTPTITPFYPFFGAIIRLLGLPLEIAARTCSLLFSGLLFLSVWGIGKKIGTKMDVLYGLVILCFTPVLITLSYSILSESSYIAIIYLGLWIYWNQYRNPKYMSAMILGILFGLAFLDRTEGILYIIIIPILQVSYLVYDKFKSCRIKKILAWSFVYIISFTVIIAPQIYRVSNQMGRFSINGRQVWSIVYNKPDGKSYWEKFYGLDYSPSEVNIAYLQTNSKVVDSLSKDIQIKRYIRTFMDQFKLFYQERLGILVGPLGLMFFGFGLLALYGMERRYEIFLILAFISFNLIAPLMYTSHLRVLSVIVPIFLVVEGIGIGFIGQNIYESCKQKTYKKYIIPLFILLLIICSWVFVLRDETLNPPKSYPEYSPQDLQEPIKIIKEIERNELHRPPKIVAQLNYISYYGGGEGIRLPFTSYEKLVKYCELNNADFLYLHYGFGSSYPFMSSFIQKRGIDDFILLYRAKDSYFGKEIELYRFNKIRLSQFFLIGGILN